LVADVEPIVAAFEQELGHPHLIVGRSIAFALAEQLIDQVEVGQALIVNDRNQIEPLEIKGDDLAVMGGGEELASLGKSAAVFASCVA
jgi:hypothetical protein